MKVTIPYDGDDVVVTLDLPCKILVPEVFAPNKNDFDILSKALSEPIQKESISEFIKGSGNLLMIVTDATRPTPTSKVLEQLHPHLSCHPNFTFLIATGTHKKPTPKEMRKIFGQYLEEFNDSIQVHDAKRDDCMVHMGKTSRGTEVFFNKLVDEADGIILINNVKPHYFAGFTGGRKSFLPGISSYKTIEMNHSHAISIAAEPMATAGNPVSEDMAEAADMCKKRVFSIQTVMTHNHELFSVHAGDLNGSFNAAVESAKSLFSVPLEEQANIVLTANQYPMDINLYQSQHAIENGRLAIQPNGVMILISACQEGVGNDLFLQLFNDIPDNGSVDHIGKENYRLGHHKVHRILKMKEEFDIWAVTKLDDDSIKRSGMKPYGDIQLALDDAIDVVISRGMEPNILIMPNGGVTVPVLID